MGRQHQLAPDAPTTESEVVFPARHVPTPMQERSSVSTLKVTR
jgi:hypothetical protein